MGFDDYVSKFILGNNPAMDNSFIDSRVDMVLEDVTDGRLAVSVLG